MMRVLALLLVLLGTPALAAPDYTPWADQGDQPSFSSELAQAPARQGQGQGQGQGQDQGGGGGKPTPSLSGGDYPGRYCCIHCRPNEIACGGECIPAKLNGKPVMCKQVAGCACPGKP